MSVTQLNQPVVVDALAGLGLAPSAYHRGRAVGFRRNSPKSRMCVVRLPYLNLLCVLQW